MSDEAKRSIRQSVRGADRALRVIEGGGSGAPQVPQGGSGDCPVTALGHLDGTFYFLDVRGQKRELSARALGSRHDIVGLFGGDDGWLRTAHPKKELVNKTDKDAAPEWRVVDFRINDAAASLQRACFSAGLYGDHVVLRRPGIWRGPDGAPAVHCGDAVLIGTDWHDAGTRTGSQVWAAAPPVARPAAPCAAAVGRELQDGLTRLWRWREAGSPVAMMGLICNAYYGAATEWRPAGFITGETGGGKSSLLKVVRAALPLHHYDNDTSKAGIEQAVQGRAMAIVIDEASDRANRSSARDLVDLVLSAAGGEGTKGSRGTVDGKGRKIEVAGLIMMFSINAPDLEPQHLGRFTLVDLRKPADGEDFRDEHEALARLARTHAAELWGRALAGWDRYALALQRFRDGLGKSGCAPRERDQAGALLAGWWVLTQEGVPDERGVREGIGAFVGHVRIAAEVEADSRPRRMVAHLLSSMVELHRSSEREPLGKLLAIAFGGSEEYPLRSPDDARDLLANNGIRVVRRCVDHGSPRPVVECGCVNCREPTGQRRPVPRLSSDAGVWFANRNPQLSRLFVGTPFEGGRWRAEMMRLETARSSGRNVRVGEVTGYAVWVGRDDLLLPDTGDPPVSTC